MFRYPSTATERFDNAKVWINYVVTIIKSYIGKNVLEVGAGCGSFTSNYLSFINFRVCLSSNTLSHMHLECK